MVGDAQGQCGRLGGSDKTTRGPISLDGGDRDHPKRSILEWTELQPHGLRDDALSDET